MTVWLGKREPQRKATIDVADFLRVPAVIPEHPLAAEPPPYAFPMDFNDRAGVCVVASCDHALQTISGLLGQPRANWSEQQILEFYQTQNPNFKSWSQGGTDADGGMYVQEFLRYLVDKREILAFGKIDHNDPEMLEAAVWVGLAIVTGSELQVAQQTQNEVWNYVPNSRTWGGHATALNGYGADFVSCVTWAEKRRMTRAFVEHQMDEAWLVLTPAMIKNPTFRNHFDLAGFSAAIRELTNDKVIVPVPEPVPPASIELPVSLLDRWALRELKDDPRYVREAKRAYRRWREQ